ncbi:hypothetical protein Acsp04_48120 [Actinomadura sp. NBRC 104425]|uniref:SAM-dependent methyltransferase n=1 Tax=Actinomadura sp. NBRC 104425 TaxID=3032204 RepID=UPI0024A1EFC7|nr:SAM-dependent methyltransferase [Actinomadura sp. NBRC 104425]GLZ14577.1 hypothetical protein Acsp04_48120 [Actinomadura sp. NBRC 104425]
MSADDWHRRVDPSKPHPARMYDYYLGGKDNFEADREAAEQVLRVLPEVRLMALENRAFLGRAVRFLAAAGIRQFLDIGTGLPTQGSTSEVAHEVAPDARIVYVDNDPMVLVHARALLADRAPGDTVVIEGDVRDPDAILGHPDVRAVIDFDQPVALLLVAILHFVRDSEDPAGIVERFMRDMAPGSYLVLSHATHDFDPERSAEGSRPYANATAPFVTRSGAEIKRFFDGLEMVDPGLVQLPLWRPDGDPSPHLDAIWVYGGVARRG